MKSLRFLTLLVSLLVLLLVDHIHALSLIASTKNHPSVVRSDEVEQKVIRVKRAPLLKLPLLAGAALIGKKALLLGGAAVGAKALAGAGIVGAGALYKAKYYSGGYGGGYTSYQYAPSTYVESSWG